MSDGDEDKPDFGDRQEEGSPAWAVTMLRWTSCCGKPPVKNKKYDAYYCPVCYEWHERNCGDWDCNYCKERPATAQGADRGSDEWWSER